MKEALRGEGNNLIYTKEWQVAMMVNRCVKAEDIFPCATSL